ncbi:transglycosylase domain-containing protein [Kineosporia babensis]|uniref:Transglycosylase domain-containing protein n=1 Tax=Kineosporia babensis TaxID=499548 RepID=A0A9X1SUD5_9ACTN|nr:transglycosylase domain-containing protein [Kineosporia babensis]MCD5312789.1 transglycosylase domain-containing protein [Kineosporia babensis]
MSESHTPGRKSLPRLIGAFAAASLVGGLLVAGLAAPAVSATGLASNDAVNAFLDLPSELADTPVASNTQILAADGSPIATFYDENRVPVKLDQVSPFLQDAVVSIEDERFFEHSGVDTEGLIRAAAVTMLGTGSQGASTLTQQLVKNTLAQEGFVSGDKEKQAAAGEKSSDRKLREIRLATALEQRLSKQEILERYLNIAWFGGQTSGVQAASKYYFGTTAEKVTLPQAAMLAGMIHAPAMYDLDELTDQADEDRALGRRNRVLAKMLSLGKIDQAAHDEAVKAPLKMKITPTRAGCANARTKAYFCDYVYNVITKSDDFKALGETQEDRENAFMRGGYTITTTLEPKILKAAWNSVKTRIPPKDDSRVATATVTVEPGTGKVLSITQNKFYNPKQARQNTTVNYSTDYRYGGSSGFQTGSTFKPVVLASWLDAGHSLYDSVDGSPGTAAMSSFRSCGGSLGGSPWPFKNSADGAGQGSMSVWNATKDSVNGAFVRMAQRLDLCDIQKMAGNLGMHRAQAVTDPCIPGNYDKKKPKTTTKVPQCEPSVILGTASQSPMTMASAYATFASGGIRCNPIVVTSIKDRNQKKVKIPGAKCKQTISEKVANTTTTGLSKVFTTGTAGSVGTLPNGQPASGKTGTTNSSQDTWFVGYTPQLATAVWVGPETVNGDRRTMQGIRINNQWYGAVYGATFAAKIWKDVTSEALEGEPVKQFGSPDSSLIGTPPPPPEPEKDKNKGRGGNGGGQGNGGGLGDGGGNQGGPGGNPGNNGGPGNDSQGPGQG